MTDVIFSTIGADPDLSDLVEEFVSELPGRARALRQLHAAGEEDELRRAAHQLKGAAGSYGFAPISDAARDLETAVKDSSDPESFQRALERVTAFCNAARSGQPDA